VGLPRTSCFAPRRPRKEPRQLIDLTGQVIGEWTVLYEAERRPPYGNRYWLCRFSCGVEREVWMYSLRRGMSRSCGHWTPPEICKYGHRLFDENLVLSELPTRSCRSCSAGRAARTIARRKGRPPVDHGSDRRLAIQLVSHPRAGLAAVRPPGTR
jgi:hypothetical protein